MNLFLLMTSQIATAGFDEPIWLLVFALILTIIGFRLASGKKTKRNATANKQPSTPEQKINYEIKDTSETNEVSTKVHRQQSPYIRYAILLVVILLLTLPFHYVPSHMMMFPKNNFTFNNTFIFQSDIDALLEQYDKASIFEKMTRMNEPLFQKLIEKHLIYFKDNPFSEQSNSENESSSNNSTQNSTSSEQVKNQTFRMGDEIKIGEDVTVKLNKVEDYKPNNEFEQPSPENKAVAIEVEYFNPTQDKPYEVSSAAWVLFDSEDYFHDNAITIHKRPYLISGTVNPGGKMKGWISFEIPKNTTPKKVQFKYDNWNNKNIEIVF